MKHKLMDVMRGREDSRQLEGRVKIGDACPGGERTGGQVGRGSQIAGAMRSNNFYNASCGTVGVVPMQERVDDDNIGRMPVMVRSG